MNAPDTESDTSTAAWEEIGRGRRSPSGSTLTSATSARSSTRSRRRSVGVRNSQRRTSSRCDVLSNSLECHITDILEPLAAGDDVRPGVAAIHGVNGGSTEGDGRLTPILEQHKEDDGSAVIQTVGSDTEWIECERLAYLPGWH